VAPSVPLCSWKTDQPGAGFTDVGGWRGAPLCKFCISDTLSAISLPFPAQFRWSVTFGKLLSGEIIFLKV